MTQMTHEDFLKRLAELDTVGGADSLESLLPADALAHARDCEDCTRTAEALLLLGSEDAAHFDEPDAAYWQGFDERLAKRLDPVRRPARPEGGASRGLPWLRAAAVLAVVAGLSAALVSRIDTESDEPQVAEIAVEHLDAELELWSEDEGGFSSLPELDGELTFAILEEDASLPTLLGTPAGSIFDPGLLELDDSQAAELARRLRAEISS